MTEYQKKAIIESGKEYFRSTIIPNHLKNLQKLKLKDFNVNPFLINYLAAFLCGNTEPESLAKALVYPRVLETIFSTSSSQNIQFLISSFEQINDDASDIAGIDIEFVDALDGRKKYGIFASRIEDIDGLTNILGKCKKAIIDIDKDHWYDLMDDVIVFLPFGNKNELKVELRTISTTYPVLCGMDFWNHLTGDPKFYNNLLIEFCKIMDEEQVCFDLLNDVVNSLKAA